MSDHLAGLTPANLAILFEPDPYSYDCTVTDPSLLPSPFVQAMREQEERFYAAFPEARKAAEHRNLRRAQLRALLAYRNATHSSAAQGPSPLNHIYNSVPELPAIPTRYHHAQLACYPSLDEEPKPDTHLSTVTALVPTPQPQQQPQSPTLHDRHPEEGEHHSRSQLIHDKPSCEMITNRLDRIDSRPTTCSSTPRPSSTPQSRANLNKNSKTPGSKRRVGPSIPRKRPQQKQRKQRNKGPLDIRKPTLACLFCRGRKIACGAPLPGTIGKTCNQCQRRSLICEFPESRRGMRRRKFSDGSDEGPDDQCSFESILSP